MVGLLDLYGMCAGSTLVWFGVFINIELLFTIAWHFLKGAIICPISRSEDQFSRLF
jgi:hypothetical protein